MLNIINHPLIKHKLGIMRSSKTSSKEFRELMKEIAMLLCYEATKDLRLESSKVLLWTGKQEKVERLTGKKPVLVPIWRAGHYFSRGIEELIPSAKINPIGLSRDDTTLKPKIYYENWCSDISKRTVFVVDPMLATAGSMDFTLNRLKQVGCTDIRAIVLIAAPEGKVLLEKNHPEVPVYAAALDTQLDKSGYIHPGLGDAGDRLFGTY